MCKELHEIEAHDQLRGSKERRLSAGQGNSLLLEAETNASACSLRSYSNTRLSWRIQESITFEKGLPLIQYLFLTSFVTLADMIYYLSPRGVIFSLLTALNLNNALSLCLR